MKFLYYILASFTVVLHACSNAETIRHEKPSEQIDTLLNAAARSADLKNPLEAIRFIDSALAGKKLGVAEQFKVYNFKCNIYHYKVHDAINARKAADSMLLLIQKNNPEKYKEELALANYSMGDVLFKEGNYTDAYTYYYTGRFIVKNYLDACTMGEYSFRLSMVLFRQSRYYEAAENFKQAFEETKSCAVLDIGKFYRLQQLLNNTGLSYYRANMPDSAITYYNKALVLINEEGKAYTEKLNDEARGVVYGNLAAIYKEKGDYNTAKDLLKRSIAINTQKGFDNRDAQYSLLKLADVMYAERKTDSMKLLLDKTIASINTIENREAEMQWHRLMWKYHNHLGENSKAYEHLTRFTDMSDSADIEDNKLKSTDLSRQIRMLEDQYQIEALQKQNQIKDLYLLVIIIAVILVLVISFFIFQNLKRSKKHITALKALNQQVSNQKAQLEEALKVLEQKNNEQNRILKVVAHDLRTPIAAISMLTDVIMRANSEEQKKEMIHLVKTSADNSLNMIKEILEASATSPENLKKAPVDINTLIHDCTEVLKFEASKKGQNISVSLLPYPKKLNIDQEKIWRVIANLITNAIKFSAAGSEIKIRAVEADNKITLAVEDKGIGIPAHLQPNVFDMFTGAKRKGTAGEKPYGLGLSISRQIITAHGGKIWFESRENEGTTFFIELQ